MDVNKDIDVGLYEPSEIEKENCENGKCCEFGICEECTIGYGKSS